MGEITPATAHGEEQAALLLVVVAGVPAPAVEVELVAAHREAARDDDRRPRADDARHLAVPTGDWNAVHLSVRGNTSMHVLNGRVMSVTIGPTWRTGRPTA